ncbi:MAG: hypothetical protein IJM18_06925 [Clostridia bacterium]|nr:hypothetical protein [Clostridia bacterium]
MRELRRVIFSRAAVFMLLLLTAIGAVLFLLHTRSSDIDKRYPEVFTARYHELIDEYKDEAPLAFSAAELSEKAEESRRIGTVVFHLKIFGDDEVFSELLADDPELAARYESGELAKYLEEPLLAEAEEEAYAKLKEQFGYLADFDRYYSEIKKQAERMQHTSIFGDPSSFAYRNTVKTVKDFAAIDGAVGTLGDDRAVTSVFDDPIADHLMLLFMTVVSVLMLRERRNGLWQLVRATAKGRAHLAFSRILTLLAAALLATLFIFGSRVVISYLTYNGLEYGDRLIQSVRGFNGIPFPMSVNAFVLLYCGIKVVCTFFAGILLFLLLSSIKNINIAIAVTGAVLVLEYALYSTVRDSSILVPLKYINIFQLIVPRGFMVNYLNLNVFERPLNVRAAVSIAMSAVSLLGAVGIMLVHVLKRPVGKPNPIEKLIDGVRKRTYKRVFPQETGKVLFAQRGVLVLIVLVFVFFSFGSLPRPTVTDEQRAALSYYKKYAGSVSEATLTSIDEDTERIRESMQTAESFVALNYQNTLAGLGTLREEVEDIIARNASGEYAREIKLLPPFTYMTVFGENSRSFETGQGLKALLLICLFTAGMYAYERQSGMTKLLRSLPNGRSRLFWKKGLLTLALGVLVFAAVYLPEIIALAKNEAYGGFSHFGYPMQGLELLRESRLPISVGTVTVLVYAARLLAIFLVGSAAGLISSLTDRVNTALVAVCAVFVVPACLAAMGAGSIYDLTPLPLLFAVDALFYKRWVPTAVCLLVLLAMIAFNYAVNCGRRTTRNMH